MNWVRHILVSAVRVYQRLVSPCLHALAGAASGCRFTPTCSEYAAQAITRHGPVRGSFLAAGRLCRCHPWGGHGHDPVPRHIFQNPARAENLPSRRAGLS